MIQRLANAKRSAIWLAGWVAVATVLTAATSLLAREANLDRGLTQTIFQGGFNGLILSETVVTDVDLTVLEKDSALPRRLVSVRWEGHWYLSRTQQIELSAGADDRVTIVIDEVDVLVRDIRRGMHTVARSLTLAPGVHDVRIDYQQDRGGYALNVGWAPTGEPARPLSTAPIFVASPTAAQREAIGLRERLWIPMVASWVLGPIGWFIGALVPRLRARGRQQRGWVAGRSRLVLLLTGIVVAALIVRIGFLAMTVEQPAFAWVDPDRYTVSARAFTEGGVPWHWNIDAFRYQEYFKAPLYPVFLSIFDGRPPRLWWAAAAQAGLGALSILAVFFLGRRLHSTTTGVAAALAYGLYFPEFAVPATFMQERLYIPLLVTALAVLASVLDDKAPPWRFATAGAVLGIAALTRAMPIYFIVPCALIWWLAQGRSGRAAAQSLALAAGFACTTLPYCLWLMSHTGQFIAIENIGAFGIVRRNVDSRTFIAGDTPTIIELGRIIGAQVFEDPAAYLREKVQLVWLMLGVRGGRVLEWHSSFATPGLAGLMKWLSHATGDLVFASAAVLAPMGLVLARRRAVAYLLGGWVAVHLILTAVAGYAGARFRSPIEAPLLVLAACVVAGGWRPVHRSQIAVGVVVAMLVGSSAAISAPRSLGGRADYGMGPWRSAETAAREATVAAGLPVGFNVRLNGAAASPGDNRLAGVLTTVHEWPHPVEVEVWVDGQPAGAVTVDNGESHFELALEDRTAAFVELRPAGPVTPRLAVGLFDHAPGRGR